MCIWLSCVLITSVCALKILAWFSNTSSHSGVSGEEKKPGFRESSAFVVLLVEVLLSRCQGSCLPVPDRNIFVVLAQMAICMCCACALSSFPMCGLFRDSFFKAEHFVVCLVDSASYACAQGRTEDVSTYNGQVKISCGVHLDVGCGFHPLPIRGATLFSLWLLYWKRKWLFLTSAGTDMKMILEWWHCVSGC